MDDLYGIGNSRQHFDALEAIRRQSQLQENRRNLHENPVLAIKPVIQNQIRAFEASLEQLDDPTLYVGAWLASFGQQRLIVVHQIQLEEPCLIIFHGLDEQGLPLSLIQHANQLNFLLQAFKRETDEPRRPIGFVHNG